MQINEINYQFFLPSGKTNFNTLHLMVYQSTLNLMMGEKLEFVIKG